MIKKAKSVGTAGLGLLTLGAGIIDLLPPDVITDINDHLTSGALSIVGIALIVISAFISRLERLKELAERARDLLMGDDEPDPDPREGARGT